MSSELWIISKQFTFEAAHKLPKHDGKCARLHGHSWQGEILIAGNELITSGAKEGMLQDFGDIKKAFKPLLDNYLDHHYLNESTGLANPTSESLAKWLHEKLVASGLAGIYGVRVNETCTSSCLYVPKRIAEENDAGSLLARSA